MKIKGAIFDMDGTLVDSLFFWSHLWRRIGKVYFDDEGFLPEEKIDRAVRTMIYTDAMTFFKKYYRLPGSTDEFITFASLEIENFYRTVAKSKVGAAELLSHLKQLGIKTALASATDKDNIKIALAACGLSDYFDAVFSCAELGVGKDKPNIYYAAADALGFTSSEICVVEDSYVAIETAKAAGFMTVGVFDKNNFDQRRLAASSDIYVEEGETLLDLIPLITVS